MAHITKVLWDEHRKVEAMFARFSHGDSKHFATVSISPGEASLLPIICDEIEIHATIEEEVLYPMLAQLDERKAETSQDEHDAVKDLIAEIQELDSNDPALPKLVQRLEKKVKLHVTREERDVFPLVKARLYHEGFEMGRQAFALRQELLGAGNRASMKAPAKHGWPGNGWG